MSYQFYNLTNEEIDKVRQVNEHAKQYVCSCAIHDKKPSFCQQGPMVNTIMPECGYKFEKDDAGEIVRIGACLRCGRCCALPRKDGDPYGFYDVKGTACRHLIVEEL